MRQNIFEKIAANSNISSLIKRIHRLFQEETIISMGTRKTTCLTLRHFIEKYCFAYWKSNANMICFNDFLNVLNFDTIYMLAVEENDLDSIIDYIEIIENCIMMFNSQYTDDLCFMYDISAAPDLDLIENNVLEVLDSLNMESKYFPDTERAIIIEKNAAVTAAAEISSNDTAFEVIFYNHHSLKGNTKEKARILNYLANDFETQRKELSRINSSLASDIACLLNSLNIRHNNVDQKSNSYHSTVAQMPPNELEAWYDELYQMLLLARLEIDNIERKQKVADLKKVFESEKQNNG